MKFKIHYFASTGKHHINGVVEVEREKAPSEKSAETIARLRAERMIGELKTFKLIAVLK